MKSSHKPLAHALLRKLLESNKLQTISSIYERITPAEDGAVHSFQNPAGTETSRFSHASTWMFEPGSTNLANLPKKTALEDPLFRVRDCIVPHQGRVLGKADYSQAEARWCAWIAQDPVRMKIYEEEIDHYKFFVALLKWEDETRWEEVSKKERNSIGKVGVLSGQYGVSWRTLLENVNGDFDLHGVAIDAKTAKKMVDIWPQMFHRTVSWWDEVREEILSKGFLVNPLGLKRYFFGRKDSSSAIEALVREGIAFEPQSANAMKLNQALSALFKKYDPKLLRILLQVHDEIVFDCRPQDSVRVARLVKEEMEKPVEVAGRTFVIPAEVEMSSKNWVETRRVA